MAKNRMNVLRLELRLKAAEALVDGADYDTVRSLLSGLGVDEADLPSDLTLKNYQSGDEYERYYNERFQVITLPRRMAELAGMEDTVEGMMEMSALNQLFLRMDAGGLDTAYILKILSYLQRRRALKVAEEEQMKSFATMTVSRRNARQQAVAASRGAQTAASAPGTSDEGADATDSDAHESTVTTDTEATELLARANPSKTDQIRVKPTTGASPTYANSPSASRRAAARKKRKKR